MHSSAQSASLHPGSPPIVVTWDDLKRFLRVVGFSLLAMVLAVIATVRTFGFDYRDGGARDLYPYVADGWGIWYWFAQLQLNVDRFFVVVHLCFALQIIALAFPRKTKLPVSISLVLFAYMTFWFLFGQARYGMAAACLAVGAASGSLPLIFLLGLVATLFHKAAAGGVLLLWLWHVLQKRRHGLLIALIASGVLSLGVVIASQKFLAAIGYGNYLNWSALPGANTPMKFYYLLAVLALWKLYDRKAPNKLLILTLLFLPFSYFIVFAGRAFELVGVLLLTYLVRFHAPRFVRYAVALLFLADVYVLVFQSGMYL